LECAKITWPSLPQFEELAERIANKEPSIDACFGFVDGMHIATQNSSDHVTQNAEYNSWLGITSTSNVLVFAPTGLVIWAALNMPGSWHDASLCPELIDLLLDTNKTPPGYYLCGDSAFPHCGIHAGLIQTPLTVAEEGRLRVRVRQGVISPSEFKAKLAFSSAVCSVRQAAEWGVRGIRSKLPRLYRPMSTNSTFRLLLTRTAILLYNFRVRTVGLSQIRTVFN
jgi:hypothetical protein